MKIDRLIGIIMILLQEDKVTAPKLAKRFEVSRRTINRDLETLCKSGIPVITTQGRGGGIAIASGYKINKTFFTQDELQTIAAALKGMDSVSKQSYQQKFLERLSGKNAPITVNDFILIDLASFYQKTLTDKIELFKQAIGGSFTTAFCYYGPKGEAHRTIEPYYIIFKWSAWYIMGYCLDSDGFRMFKLNRLWDLKINQTVFTPRAIPAAQMDFGAHLLQPKSHLKAIFSKEAKYRLIEEYGIESFSSLKDGQLLFERDFTNYDYMLQWILSFGDKVSVMAPEGLKKDICRQAQNILGRVHMDGM